MLPSGFMYLKSNLLKICRVGRQNIVYATATAFTKRGGEYVHQNHYITKELNSYFLNQMPISGWIWFLRSSRSDWVNECYHHDWPRPQVQFWSRSTKVKVLLQVLAGPTIYPSITITKYRLEPGRWVRKFQLFMDNMTTALALMRLANNMSIWLGGYDERVWDTLPFVSVKHRPNASCYNHSLAPLLDEALHL